MRNNLRASSALHLLTFICIGLAFLNIVEMLTTSTCAQDDCPEMTVGGPAITWPKGTTVVVFFDPYNVSPQDKIAYEQVVNSWNNFTSNSPGIDVKFTLNTSDPSPNTMMIRNSPVQNPTYRGLETATYDTNTGKRTHSDIEVSPNVTDIEAKARVLSHEIAHTLGLNHPSGNPPSNQYTTKTSNSYYRPSEGFNDITTGSKTPTDCDANVIQTIYDDGGFIWGNQGGTGTGGGGGDGGGGGGGDDGGGGDGGGNGCSMETIPGQCYEVCVTYCYGNPDPYTGNYDPGQCQESCGTECDPDQYVWVCW